jgi:hypothetical protein
VGEFPFFISRYCPGAADGQTKHADEQARRTLTMLDGLSRATIASLMYRMRALAPMSSASSGNERRKIRVEMVPTEKKGLLTQLYAKS